MNQSGKKKYTVALNCKTKSRMLTSEDIGAPLAPLERARWDQQNDTNDHFLPFFTFSASLLNFLNSYTVYHDP